MTKTTKTFRTPRGKNVTVAQYLASQRRLSYADKASECEYGHDGCAAWDRGPCLNEILCEQEAEE
jgi:hypothetical protein